MGNVTESVVPRRLKQKHDYIGPRIETINEWREKNEVSNDSPHKRIYQFGLRS